MKQIETKNKITEGKKSFYKSFIPDEWNSTDFDSVFTFVKTFSFSRKQLSNSKTTDEIRNVHYGDIHAKYKGEILDFEVENTVPYLKDGLISKTDFEDIDFPTLQDGDLIIADASEDYGGICKCIELKNVRKNKVVAGLHTFAARSSEKNVAIGFKTYVLKHPEVVRELRRIATGISVYGISKNSLSTIKVALPQINEQHKIADILSNWDLSIRKTEQLIKQKEFHRKWFANQLLTGKTRFPQFVTTKNRIKTKIGELPEDWDIKYISNIVKRIRNSFTPNPNEIYQEIGIRSHTKGIFYKEPVTGKSLGNKSVFWIEPKCFVVNIVFAWEHAIAKTTEKEKGMIASHRFPMYKPKDGVLDLDYLLYFFKSKRGKHLLGLASPGGAGRNKTLGQSEFIKLQIPVPGIEEQKAIVNAISAADRELYLLEKKLNKLKEQKKGLMQQLLTGKTRITNHHKI
jgi:type I restriction enzyme S subunit